MTQKDIACSPQELRAIKAEDHGTIKILGHDTIRELNTRARLKEIEAGKQAYFLFFLK